MSRFKKIGGKHHVQGVDWRQRISNVSKVIISFSSSLNQNGFSQIVKYILGTIYI